MLWFAPMLLASRGMGKNDKLPRDTADLKRVVTEYGDASTYVILTVELSASGEIRPSPTTMAVSDFWGLSDVEIVQNGSGAVSIFPV